MVKIGNKKKFFFKKIWVNTWYNKFVNWIMLKNYD